MPETQHRRLPWQQQRRTWVLNSSASRQKDTPKTYRIFMQYPVEVTECWANISEGRKIDAGVKTSVGEILEGTLFKMIGDAFLADGAVTEEPKLTFWFEADSG